MRRLILAIGFLLAGPAFAQAQSLRSDSPLWTYQTEPDAGLFPEPFFSDDEIGCSVPIYPGLYRYAPTDREQAASFVRLEMYGVFHCALIYGESELFEDVGEAFEDHAWLVVLSSDGVATLRPGELLALQIGVRNGSRYVLLRRRAANPSRSFDILEARCPANADRRTASIDIWSQDVCVVRSKADLRRIARTAARLPVSGILEQLPENHVVPQNGNRVDTIQPPP